jgi:hypothetical protein
MWEELKCPLIPLIFYGAYELHPQSRWMIPFPIPGRVVVRCLPAIQTKETSNRDEMCLLLRKRMLNACADLPRESAESITTAEWFFSLVCALGVYVGYYIVLMNSLPWILQRYQLSSTVMLIRFTLVSLLITGILYVYVVIIRTRRHSSRISVSTTNNRPTKDSNNWDSPTVHSMDRLRKAD